MPRAERLHMRLLLRAGAFRSQRGLISVGTMPHAYENRTQLDCAGQQKERPSIAWMAGAVRDVLGRLMLLVRLCVKTGVMQLSMLVAVGFLEFPPFFYSPLGGYACVAVWRCRTIVIVNPDDAAVWYEAHSANPVALSGMSTQKPWTWQPALYRRSRSLFGPSLASDRC